MMIGEIFCNKREKQHISQKELAQLLAQEGIYVTNQAISKWENGSTLPNALQFLALCKVLEITDISATFMDAPPKTPFDRLNDQGKQKAQEYVQLLLKSGMYEIEPQPATVIPLRTLPLYHISVSAGTGQFLDSDDYDLVEVSDEVPMSANFGVRISGDSMIPRFADGQIVWVHQQQTLQNGEIGIFIYNGDAYCKKLQTDGQTVALVSLNKDYAPITVTEDCEFRVFGKVVG